MIINFLQIITKEYILNSFRRKLFWVFIFSVVAVCLVWGMIAVNNRSNSQKTFWINHTYQVISLIDRLNTIVAGSGSTKAEYALSGNAVAKRRFYQNRTTLMQHITYLGELTRDNPVQQANLHTLLDSINSSQSREDKFFAGQGARPLSTQESSGSDLLSLRPDSSILSILYTMQQQETELLIERQKDGRQESRKAAYLLSGGALLTVVLILLLLTRLNRDIRLRREAEELLHKSESKYRNLVENAAAVIYSCDILGNINFASDKGTALTGYSLKELNGMHFSTLVDPSAIQQVTAHYVEQIRSRTPETTLIFPIITKTGEKKWVEQFVVLETGKSTGFQCIVKDISRQQRMQQELEASELKLKQHQMWLESILDNTTSVIFIKDLTGRYLLVNKQFKEMRSISEEAVIGRTNYELLPKAQADHYKLMDEEVIRTRRSIEFEEWVDTPQGRRNLLLIKFPLLDDKGNIFGISGIATDITERTNYQQELIRATKDAEEAKKMQEQFLANMSHEIRTPMNGIQGMTNLLLETSLTEQQSEFAHIIRRCSNNLLVIVNDILDFSKIKANKLVIEKIEFSLKDVLDNIKGVFSHRVKKKGIDLWIQTDPSLPELLRGDPYRLNQVLINLVGNAIKFTEEGHVGLSVKQIAATATGGVIRFSVTDTGVGISEENLDRIFDSFSQAGTDTARIYGGTGLGLTISQQLIRLQGGQIHVTSTAGKGSSFEFEIPYDYCDDVHRSQKNVPNIYDHAGLLRDKYFLVAEDNEVNQKLIEYVLKKAGGIVDIVANGQEAVDKLKEGNRFDIIVMDLQMPVMDGYAASRIIREEISNSIPIIAMTATALNEERQRCLDAGMSEYMTKPFEIADLYRCIDGLLRQTALPALASDNGKN